MVRGRLLMSYPEGWIIEAATEMSTHGSTFDFAEFLQEYSSWIKLVGRYQTEQAPR